MFDAFYERDGGSLPRDRADPRALGPRRPARRSACGAARLRDRGDCPDAAEFQVGRVTFEILRSVPIAPVRVQARVVRPGRRVQMVEAELSDAEGEVLMRVRGWRLRTAELELPAEALIASQPPPPPEQGAERRVLPDRRGARLPLGDGGALRRRRLPRARAGDRLAADAPAAGRRGGADSAAAHARRRRRRQRRSAPPSTSAASSSSTSTSPSTWSGCRRGSGSASTR